MVMVWCPVQTEIQTPVVRCWLRDPAPVDQSIIWIEAEHATIQFSRNSTAARRAFA